MIGDHERGEIVRHVVHRHVLIVLMHLTCGAAANLSDREPGQRVPDRLFNLTFAIVRFNTGDLVDRREVEKCPQRLPIAVDAASDLAGTEKLVRLRLLAPFLQLQK